MVMTEIVGTEIVGTKRILHPHNHFFFIEIKRITVQITETASCLPADFGAQRSDATEMVMKEIVGTEIVGTKRILHPHNHFFFIEILRITVQTKGDCFVIPRRFRAQCSNAPEIGVTTHKS